MVLADHWRAGSAIGGGLGRGEGAPLMRLLASFEYAPDYCIDKDGDGICADRDACPELAGVPSPTRLTNGCPRDRDRDGFVDEDDKCPDQPGVKTGDSDHRLPGSRPRRRAGQARRLPRRGRDHHRRRKDPRVPGAQARREGRGPRGADVGADPVPSGTTAELDPASEPMLEAVAKLLTEKTELHVAIVVRAVAPDAPPELAEQRATSRQELAGGARGGASRLAVQTPSPTAAPADGRSHRAARHRAEGAGRPAARLIAAARRWRTDVFRADGSGRIDPEHAVRSWSLSVRNSPTKSAAAASNSGGALDGRVALWVRRLPR